MPSCSGHLSWEDIWHKTKQMLIAEPYEAAVQDPNDLIGLDQPHLGPSPTPCPWPRGPISAWPWAPSPALSYSWRCPRAYWSLTCSLCILGWPHAWPVASHVPDGHLAVMLNNIENPFMWVVSQALCSTGDLAPMTNISEHFLFQGLTLISVPLNGLTFQPPTKML